MRFILSIMALLIFTPGYSQNVLQLTFQDAVKLGLQNNIDLKQEQNNLIRAKSNYAANLIDYGAPTINANSSMEKNIGNSFSRELGYNITGKRDFVSSSISANYTLFNGLNKYYSLKQSKNLQDAQLYNIKWGQETVINNVTVQYLNSLLNKELLKIAENNLILQRDQLEKISEQVSLGVLAEVEKINQEYIVKNAEVLVIRARAELKTSYTSLLQLLQVDPSRNLDLVEPDWSTFELENANLSIKELINEALTNRADLKQSEEQSEAALAQTKAIRGFYYPSVSAYAAYGSAYNFIYPNEDIPNPQNREFSDQYLEDNVQQIYGLSISIPILNGFNVRNNVVQAKIIYENTLLANENLINTIKTQVIQAYQNYQAAILDFDATKAQLEAAELAFNLEKERFSLGASDQVAYSQANQNLVSAQADYAQSYYTLAFQEILLSYATGTLSVEDIPAE